MVLDVDILTLEHLLYWSRDQVLQYYISNKYSEVAWTQGFEKVASTADWRNATGIIKNEFTIVYMYFVEEQMPKLNCSWSYCRLLFRLDYILLIIAARIHLKIVFVSSREEVCVFFLFQTKRPSFTVSRWGNTSFGLGLTHESCHNIVNIDVWKVPS